MKRNIKITFSALMAALASAFMLLSYFPYLTYAIPAIAGLFIMVTVIEINCKYALFSYLASALIVFFVAEPEGKLMYIFLLGYYPIAKAIIERLKFSVLQWILKFALFNIAVVLVYSVFAKLFGISVEELGNFGKWSAVILLVSGNVVFVLYDITVSRMALMYINRIRPKINRYFK